MPNESRLTAGSGTSGKALLESLLKLAQTSPETPPQPRQIDPQAAQRLFRRILALLTEDGDRGDRARAGLRQLARGARELLELLVEGDR